MESDNLQNNADGMNENTTNLPENTQEVNENTETPQNNSEETLENVSEETVEQIPEETVEVASEISEEVPEEVISEVEEEKTEVEETETVEATELNSEESQEKDNGEDYHAEEDVENSENEEEEEEDEIPFKNYDELSLSVLVGEAKNMLKNHPARLLREHFNQIREVIKEKLQEEEQEKREAFLSEGGEVADFHFDQPIRREFNAIYNDYRKQLEAYYKEQEKKQQENLTERLQIIEELKALYQDINEDNSNIFVKFRNLKTRWHNAGNIPRAQAGNVFKTYFHHLDNFYEYLDLNKELREMDYSHNLQMRESIIKRAEELVQEDNVQKALNELQYLHRLWKEEAVPVAEELREPTWQKFKELTNKIHDRKTEISERQKKEQTENLHKKQEIITEIQNLYQNSAKKSHGEWQSGIRKLNALREKFIAIGRVPREANQKTWNEFKAATREFNHNKNEFYKTLKAEQQANLDKKMELLNIAKEHAQSSDWANSVQVIKRIQSDWKKIGHVPRKFSDSIWKEFKVACNQFFDNYKERGNKASAEFEANLAKKQAVLDELKNFKVSEDMKANMDAINELNVRWGTLGKVPASKMNINTEFSKEIGKLIKSFGLTDNEVQDFKMASLVEQIKSGQDDRLLDDEIRKTRKTIEELEKEINQLETNIGFFSNADADNPLLKDVFKQIEEKRRRLTESEIRLRKLHRIDFEDDETSDSEEKDAE
ncbi:MAG: DUF349 domain-containing protein [Weeksellaceae bacterium]|jgi:hypothetical protein|nr:DUF349 domain-containing protein [Weeksellaceae bacterium]